MVEKGSPRYYEELLDMVYRSLLALYIMALVGVWVVWVFSHHAYGRSWYLMLACGIGMACGYVLIYFTPLSSRLSERYHVRARR